MPIDRLRAHLAPDQPSWRQLEALAYVPLDLDVGRELLPEVLALLGSRPVAEAVHEALLFLSPLPAAQADPVLRLATEPGDLWVRACAARSLLAFELPRAEVVPVLERLLDEFPVGARSAAWCPLLSLAPDHERATSVFCEELRLGGYDAYMALSTLRELGPGFWSFVESKLQQHRSNDALAARTWNIISLRSRDGDKVLAIARAHAPQGAELVEALAATPGGDFAVRALARVARSSPGAVDEPILRGLLAATRTLLEPFREWNVDQLGCLVEGLLPHAHRMPEIDVEVTRAAALAPALYKVNPEAGLQLIQRIVDGVIQRPHAETPEPLRRIVETWVRFPTFGRRLGDWHWFPDYNCGDRYELDHFWLPTLQLSGYGNELRYQFAMMSDTGRASIEQRVDHDRRGYGLVERSFEDRLARLDAVLHSLRTNLLTFDGIDPYHVVSAALLLGDTLVGEGWSYITARHTGLLSLLNTFESTVAVAAPGRKHLVRLVDTIRACIEYPGVTLYDTFRHPLPDRGSPLVDVTSPRGPFPPGERFGETLATLLL